MAKEKKVDKRKNDTTNDDNRNSTTIDKPTPKKARGSTAKSNTNSNSNTDTANSPTSPSLSSSPLIQPITTTTTTPPPPKKTYNKASSSSANTPTSSTSNTPTLLPKKEYGKKANFGIYSTLMPPQHYVESQIDSACRELQDPAAAATKKSDQPQMQVLINNELLLRNFQNQLDVLQFKSLPAPVIDEHAMSQLLHPKKPRQLKSDQPMELKQPKTVKIPRKIEKMQNKSIKYHQPDFTLRGDWTLSDDRLLIDLSQRYPTIEQIHTHSKSLLNEYLNSPFNSDTNNNNNNNSNGKRGRRHFSKEFTIQEMEERWRQLLYNENVADEAASMMAIFGQSASSTQLHQPIHHQSHLCPPWSDSELKILAANTQPNMNRINFSKLLHSVENRPYFHSSRTARQLEQVYKDSLLTKPVDMFNPYINFLSDQKQKIKSLIKATKEEITPTSIASTTTTTSIAPNNNSNNNDKSNEQQEVEEQTQPIATDPSFQTNQVDFINMNTFLYKKNDEVSNTMVPQTEWDTLLAVPPTSSAELKDDLILNPFFKIPKFIVSDDTQEDEKHDLRSIIKAEKEYNIDKERDYKSLALLRGENIRYYMKSKDIVVGRDLSPKNLIDLDLREESDSNINKISKKQFIIKLKSTQKFVIRNVGKNSVVVNGHLVLPTQTVNLQDLSLIEVCSA